MTIEIPDNDNELLAQCTVQVFRGSGHGGQSVNTTDSAVRLIHEPSGLVVVARRERSQYQNKKAALARLRMQLEEKNRVQQPRIATRPGKAATERRLESKHKQSQKKQERRRPIGE